MDTFGNIVKDQHSHLVSPDMHKKKSVKIWTQLVIEVVRRLLFFNLSYNL